MAYFKTSARVPYTPDQAFELVSDVANYPSFIKWITAMRVLDERRDEHGVKRFVGDAVVGFKGFTERFSTSVTADPNRRHVNAALIKGPFRKLDANWIITDTGHGTDIELNIDYEFRNMLISMLAAANHDLAVRKIMDAFLSEARRRYGGPVLNPA